MSMVSWLDFDMMVLLFWYGYVVGLIWSNGISWLQRVWCAVNGYARFEGFMRCDGFSAL